MTVVSNGATPEEGGLGRASDSREPVYRMAAEVKILPEGIFQYKADFHVRLCWQFL